MLGRKVVYKGCQSTEVMPHFTEARSFDVIERDEAASRVGNATRLCPKSEVVS